MAKQHRHRDIKITRNVTQIGDGRIGFVTLDLAQPANGAAQCIGHFHKLEPARLAQRPQISAKAVRDIGRSMLHEEAMKK